MSILQFTGNPLHFFLENAEIVLTFLEIQTYISPKQLSRFFREGLNPRASICRRSHKKIIVKHFFALEVSQAEIEKKSCDANCIGFIVAQSVFPMTMATFPLSISH